MRQKKLHALSARTTSTLSPKSQTAGRSYSRLAHRFFLCLHRSYRQLSDPTPHVWTKNKRYIPIFPQKVGRNCNVAKKGRRSSPDLAGTTMRLVWSNNFFKQLNQFSQLSSHPSLQEDRDFFVTYVEPPLFGDIQEESVERSG